MIEAIKFLLEVFEARGIVHLKPPLGFVGCVFSPGISQSDSFLHDQAGPLHLLNPSINPRDAVAAVTDEVHTLMNETHPRDVTCKRRHR